jgi:hypothetical protein
MTDPLKQLVLAVVCWIKAGRGYASGFRVGELVMTMTKRVACPAAPGPLEGYAARFDDLFSALAQRWGFREYLVGLLALGERNKTLTCLAGAKPVVGAGQPAVQRLGVLSL